MAITDLIFKIKSRDQASGDIRKVNNAVGGLVKAAIATAAAYLTLRAAINQASAALSTFAEFEQSMADVKAITNSTDEAMKGIVATAKELGATTEFTAAQAGQGLVSLARAGFTAEESIDAVRATLQAASASGLDLATATDIVVSGIKGFNLEATEAGRVADVLAKGANISNQSMQDLGESLKFVAPIAASTGESLEAMTAAAAAMADAGLKGSLAGTGLRQALAKLQVPSGALISVFDKLGIELKDAAGNSRGLFDIVEDLQKSGADASEIFESFGIRAGTAMQILATRGVDDLRRMRTELEESRGEAERMQKVRLDTVRGQFTLLESAVDGLRIAIVDSIGSNTIKSILRSFRSAVDDMTEGVNENSEAIKDFSITIGVGFIEIFASAIELVGDAIVSFAEFKKSLNSVIGTIVTAGISASKFGESIRLASKEDVARRKSLEALQSSLIGYRAELDKDIKKAEEFAEGATATANAVRAFAEALEEDARAALDGTTKDVKETNEAMKSLVGTVAGLQAQAAFAGLVIPVEFKAELEEDLFAGEDPLELDVSAAKEDLAVGIEPIDPSILDITTGLEFGASIAQGITSGNIGGAITSSITIALEAAGDALDASAKQIIGALAPIVGGLFDLLSTFNPEEFALQIEEMANQFSRALENIGPFIAVIIDSLDEIITALITGLLGAAVSIVANIPSIIGAAVNAVVDLFGQFPNRVGAMFANIAETTVEATAGVFGALGDKIRTFLDRFFVEGFRELVDRLKGFFSETIGDAGEKFSAFMRDIASKFVNFFIKGINSAIGALNSILPGFAQINTIPAVAFAQGGFVAGPPTNRDVVPAMLTPGEFVMTSADQQAFVEAMSMLREGGGLGGGGQQVTINTGSSAGEIEIAVERALRGGIRRGTVNPNVLTF